MNIMHQIEDFVLYCNEFYGIGGIYKMYKYPENKQGVAHFRDIKKACYTYIGELMYNTKPHQLWGGGDSLDRERVRYILEDMGFAEA